MVSSMRATQPEAFGAGLVYAALFVPVWGLIQPAGAIFAVIVPDTGPSGTPGAAKLMVFVLVLVTR